MKEIIWHLSPSFLPKELYFCQEFYKAKGGSLKLHPTSKANFTSIYIQHFSLSNFSKRVTPPQKHEYSLSHLCLSPKLVKCQLIELIYIKNLNFFVMLNDTVTCGNGLPLRLLNIQILLAILPLTTSEKTFHESFNFHPFR